MKAPSILTFLIVIFCLAGVVISAFALSEHYNTKPSPCSINDRWDCGIVNHSPYAMVHGIPVALIGIVGYALLGMIAGRLKLVTVLAALAALIFTLRLTWIEWKTLGVWCIYCVGSQIVIVVVFLLALVAVRISPSGHSRTR